MHAHHRYLHHGLVRDQAPRLNRRGGPAKKRLGLGRGSGHAIGVWLAQSGLQNLGETEI
jgi:hypothetical protein